jgi:hypothetical protein
MKYKLEITDNRIGGYYEIVLYSWKRKRWWNKEKWNLEYSQIIGHNYMCPEIHKGKITIQEYFEREVQLELEKNEINEVHRIVITNGKN